MAESNADKLARGWWTEHLEQIPGGDWDVRVRFADGHALQMFLQPSRDIDLAIAAAVTAHLENDVRWTPRSERGNR